MNSLINSLFENITPDLIKIKANFLPMITVDPKVQSPLGKILNPKVYLIKSGNIIKIDPSTGQVTMADPQELNKQGPTIVDFLMWGLAVVVIYTGSVYLIKKSKTKER